MDEGRPTGRLSVIGATLVALLAISFLVAEVRDRNRAAKAEAGVSLAANDQGVVPTPDLEPRQGPATAWTGDRLFVSGGQRSVPWRSARDITASLLADSALVRLDTGAVEPLPPSPIGTLLYPISIAVDGGVLVLGRSCPEVTYYDDDGGVITCGPDTNMAAFFDVKRREWRALQLPAALVNTPQYFYQALGATTKGQAVIALRPDFFNPAEMAVWTYTPATDRWLQLPSPGVRSDGVCLARDRVVVLTSEYELGGQVVPDNPGLHLSPGESFSGTDADADGYVNPTLVSIDAAGRNSAWQHSPTGPDSLRSDSNFTLDCLGDGALVGDLFSRSMSAFDFADDAWRQPALPPVSAGNAPDSVNDDNCDVPRGVRVWTGHELVFLAGQSEVGGRGLAYDPIADAWRELDGLPASNRLAVWSGTALVGYAEPTSISSYNFCLRNSLTPVTSESGEVIPPPLSVTATAGVFEYPLPE